MKKLVLMTVIFLLPACSKEFIETANQQLALGYKWVNIPCRAPTPNVPAITKIGPDGTELVCSVLQKP
jgi:hypothetical protein